VTTVPVFTVRVDGVNAKFLMVIVFSPPDATVVAAGVDGTGLELQPAVMQAKITRMVHAILIIWCECAGMIP